MPKPTGTIPEWAKAPPVGAIVEPPSGKIDSGWALSEKPRKGYMNWWMNRVGAGLVWLYSIFDVNDDLTYPTPKARRKTFFPYDGYSTQSDVIWDTDGITVQWTNTTLRGPYEFPIRLHAGCVVTKVELHVEPGAVRPTTERMTFELWQNSWTGIYGATPTLIQGVEDDGTANGQTLTLTSLSAPITVEPIGVGAWVQLYLRVLGGSTSVVGTDLIGPGRIYYTDPGPRGY